MLDYRNVQLYVMFGKDMVQIHHVIKFEEALFMWGYIKFDLYKRAEASNEFDSKFR